MVRRVRGAFASGELTSNFSRRSFHRNEDVSSIDTDKRIHVSNPRCIARGALELVSRSERISGTPSVGLAQGMTRSLAT
jgi:hypothetical protein